MSIKKFIIRELKYHIWFFTAYFPGLPTFMFHNIRPFLWKFIGVKVGRNVGLGYGIYLDVDGTNMVEIGNDVLITAQCLLLTHRRDMKRYSAGIIQRELPYIRKGIKIEDNVSLGMRTVVMPGITIGEGSVIGANSVVTKDIPPYSIAVGNPAKVIRRIDAI